MKIQTANAAFCFLFGALRLISAADLVDCAKKSLTQELEKAKPGDTISFTGVCTGPVTIRTDNLTLNGEGVASIEGGGRDALVIAGVHSIVLSNFEVRNGLNGILGQNGAHLEIRGVIARRNSLSGISLQTGSSAVIINTTTSENGLNGLDLLTGSSATVTGAFTSSANRVFGINVNGSSITFSRATATSSGNALGVQIATASNAFLGDSATLLEVTRNIATGLTVVSGAHMVSFGGRITATENGAFGVSVNSKGGLDLDAGSVLTASNNRVGGLVLQQQSVMTIFNNPQVSGVPGFSTVNAANNLVNGIGVLTGSTLTLVNQAQINATGNGAVGLLADNGAGITLRNTTLTGNTARDLQLRFGARADVQLNLTVGTSSCEVTTLVRGFTCAP